MARDFRELLETKWDEGKFLCVGLDSDLEKIPEAARQEDTRTTIVAFNRAIIDATKDLVCAYKPNPAFYEARGAEGFAALRETIAYVLDVAPDVPVILDAKRADIISTNEQYAISAFETLRADAITVNPYLGGEPLKPFFDREDKGVIVLCHTSNPGAKELQNLSVDGGEKLYKHVARSAREKWNGKGNCCVMIGATYPEELGEVRKIVGDMPILIAGIGAQDGNLEKTLHAGRDTRARGLIVNASRSIIFASRGADFATAARKKAEDLHRAIKHAL
ncbi:orotidine-5'-phosphate decarboxylase [Candidatus Kaiserbacteria bacterium]|nr:orotidine-5'-phosphate decarboxylase [Candidatus Kaiserbacteria bacterium]